MYRSLTHLEKPLFMEKRIGPRAIFDQQGSNSISATARITRKGRLVKALTSIKKLGIRKCNSRKMSRLLLSFLHEPVLETVALKVLPFADQECLRCH